MTPMRMTVAAAICLALQGPALAQDISSAYTKIDVRGDCRHRAGKAVEDYGDWRCKGYAGVPLWLGAGDQRMFVSFGPKAQDEPAAAQTLAPFNDFYRGVVEWRLADGKPFATIIRWNVKRAADMDNRKVRGRALVVTPCRPAPSAMSAMSTPAPTQTPIRWRAKSPTNSPAISSAARTSRSCSAGLRRAKIIFLPILEAHAPLSGSSMGAFPCSMRAMKALAAGFSLRSARPDMTPSARPSVAPASPASA